MMVPQHEVALNLSKSNDHDDDDNHSVDSNFDPEAPVLVMERSSITSATLESEQYDAATIRAEFKTYQSILPKPDELLQEQHSFTTLRKTIQEAQIKMPRFLKYDVEGGIKPHHALCCLLLDEQEKCKQKRATAAEKVKDAVVRTLSLGYLQPQINLPADFIRDQFHRIAHVVPPEVAVVKPKVLLKKIKNKGLPVPNYFLSPDDDKQFPPHIALLVILQDGEQESRHLQNTLYRFAFSSLALLALFLRVVLEVIGGAGAIWGGAEVFTLRTANNAEVWRWISVAVGILCLVRFVTLNAPQHEDEGDILGPAGPWSLRTPVRLRAVCDHPFHYFVRALPPSSLPETKQD